MQLEAVNISFRYTKKGKDILKNVNLAIQEGERVGLVGPSGYGKSTLAKILCGYERPVTGNVLLSGKPLPEKGACPVQLIYQHPEKAINPRWKMQQVLEEADQFKDEILDKLGIEREWLKRYPRELSGGELQRFSIARALSKSTRFLVADEISTMLDVITGAQLWNFILEEAQKRNLGLVVISHNQALVDRVCTRVIDLREINQR